MYTRSYPERGTDIPEGYVGAAVGSTDKSADSHYIDGTKNPWENEPTQTEEGVPASKNTLGFSGILGSLFQNGRFNLQFIGFEEILIIAAAAYMLMSKDGDRECGIMLLVLLFIV